MENLFTLNLYDTPKPLCKLIDMPKGLVASERIFKENESVVTLFAMPRKQTIAKDMEESSLFLYVVEGTIEIIVEGNKHIVTAGEIIHIQKNQPIEFLALEDSKWIEFKNENCNN